MKRRSVFADKLKAFDAFVFGDEDVTKHRGAWRAHFRTRKCSSLAPALGGEGTELTTSSLILELGCFDGTFLARIASIHRDVNFIGLDWKARPLYLGAQQIAPLNLGNLALLRTRAQDMTAIFADGELDEIWLLHPEPCDRENERQNRLMSERFLIDAHRLMRREGRLILKTDHQEYFRSTLDLMHTSAIANRFTIELESSDYWNDIDVQRATADVCLAGERTFYESRFARKRQPIHYLQIRRK